ncbi:MAG TPA: protein kinase [Anaerolineae bacterium]|nr:protein kinase [Anaerolineae bacterium]
MPDPTPATCPQCGARPKPGARFCTRCGVRLGPASAGGGTLTSLLATGTPLQGGRYQVIGQLGHGGMGAVYLARDMELFGRLCVVKQMRPFFATQSERRRAEADFQREAEVLARLNHPGHPRIPEVYGYFVEGVDQYLVMKYIEGESLERRLERLERPLAEVEVTRAAQEVANALVYLHSRRPEPVIHRDIKPANIILDPEDRIWLVDFGLARAAVSHGARVMMAGGKTVAAGTPGYTPLEQWQMQPTPKSDIYALGATIHHLLTARDPRDSFTDFPELDMEVLRSFSTFPPLTELRPDVGPALANLVARCLDPDPKKRPNAQQLEIELGSLAPTGSRIFDTVKRWSPTVGEMLGTALATFVRMLFGRPAPGHQFPPQPPAHGSRDPRATGQQPPATAQRPAIPCLYCRGQGVTRHGRPCPICRGTGYW